MHECMFKNQIYWIDRASAQSLYLASWQYTGQLANVLCNLYISILPRDILGQDVE